MKMMYGSKREFTLVGLFAALLLLSHLILAGPVSAVSGVIEKFSASSFDKTVQKIKKGITANRLVLLKELDHQQMVKMVGVNAKKSKSFEVFHPRYGKKIHANDLSAFIAVPIRIMVQERGQKGGGQLPGAFGAARSIQGAGWTGEGSEQAIRPDR